MLKSKYHSKHKIVNNIKFHSELESRFYVVINKLCEKHHIDLSLQSRFKIYVDLSGKWYYYIVDFLLFKDDKYFAVDSKGFSTSESKKKVGMFKRGYPDTPIYVGGSVNLCIKEIKHYYGIQEG